MSRVYESKLITFDGDIDLFLERVFKGFIEKKVSFLLLYELFANKDLATSKAYCFTLFKSLKGYSFDYFYNQHSKIIFNLEILWKKMETVDPTTSGPGGTNQTTVLVPLPEPLTDC